MNTSPAQLLKQLEEQARALRSQHATLRIQLAEAVTDQLHSLEYKTTATTPTNATSPSSLPLPEDPAALVDELCTLHAAGQYLQYLQELQALTRHAEKLSRSAERAFNDGDAANYVREFSDAVDGFSQAMGYAIAVEQIAEQGQLSTSPALLHHGSTAVSRVYATGMTLRGMLSAAAQQALKKCAWPPPIMGDTVLDSTITGDRSNASGGTISKTEFTGFSNAIDTDAVAIVQHVCIIQLTLQRAMEYKKFAALGSIDNEFDGSLVAPVLWPAEELVAGVSAWLQHHFAQGLPTDRADKPEWLFAAAIKAARQCAPYAEELQPCVDAHQLQQWYSLQLEFARALDASAVAGVLRNHVLPRLAYLDDAAAWLHFVDEGIKFERALAPLRGIVTDTSGIGGGNLSLGGEGVGIGEGDVTDGDGLGSVVAHAMSMLEIIFEREEWSQGWLKAERDDAERQVDAAVEAHDAWKPAVESETAVAGELAALGLGGGSGAATSSSSFDVTSGGGAITDASKHEFYPPMCAQSILSLVNSLSSRQGCLFASQNKNLFTREVLQPALTAFRARLSAMLVRAEQFDHLLDDSGIPKVGAIICAAHFIEHNLREPTGILLLAVTADETLAAAVEKEAASMTTFRRQWAYKLAKIAVDTFQSGFTAYKKKLTTFAAGGGSENDGTLPPQGPSPPLLPAADKLQTLLRALSSHLDSVVFRDVWRAIALAVNFSFFNDVATEADFSMQGAEQLNYDVDALIGVFGACTSRPAAHFKESKEACKLLMMKKEEAQIVLAAVHGAGGPEALVAAGIKALNAEQVGSVLARREDLMPGEDLT
jgi:RAD50-interacting protein 1